MIPDEARGPYSMVVDGEILDGKRVKYLTKDEILAKEYKTEIMGLKNWTDAYKGEIDRLKHELSVTKHHFDQLRYGPPPEPFSGKIASLSQEVADLRARNDELSKAFAQERQAFVRQLEQERQAFVRQLETVSEKTVERTKAKELARELKQRTLRRLKSSLIPSP